MATVASTLAQLKQSVDNLAAAAKDAELFAPAGLTTVALVNASTNYTVTPQILEVLQDQVDLDFAPYWKVHTRLVSAASVAEVPNADWYILITNSDASPGSLGWHDQIGDRPYAEVFTNPSIQDGVDVNTVISHELVELMTNPFVLGYALWQDAQGNMNLSPYESADPVESEFYVRAASDGTKINLSDFILPAYFDQSNKTGPWDFMRTLSGPIPAMTAGGYLSYLVVTEKSDWQQIGDRSAGRRDATRRMARVMAKI